MLKIKIHLRERLGWLSYDAFRVCVKSIAVVLLPWHAIIKSCVVIWNTHEDVNVYIVNNNAHASTMAAVVFL